MRIVLQIEARRPALNSAKRQILHSIRTNGAQFQSMMDGVADHPFREYFEELQHLNELTLASRRLLRIRLSASGQPRGGSSGKAGLP